MKHHILYWALLLMVCSSILTLAPRPMRAQTGERCFPETGFCISGRIREYWEQNGGLPVFGYPVGPQQEELIEGRPRQVQWFERNRLELHPEHQPPYDVLLGRLGAEQVSAGGITAWPEQPRTDRSDCQYFPQTQLNVCGRFLEAWRSFGLSFDGQPGNSFAESLALFGFPLTNEMTLTMADGQTYTVQYFERTRFEYHPENDPPYDVLFGLLGNELRAGTLPPRPQALLPAPLYFIRDNLIVRLERDGRTTVPVVEEQAGPIMAFDISPRDGSFAYVVDLGTRNDLVRTDATGANRRLLLSNGSPNGPSLGAPVWSPDGAHIAIRIGELLFDVQGRLALVPAESGPPQTLQPDDNSPNSPNLAYLPVAWSPDGDYLLMNEVIKQSEGCMRVVKEIATGELLVPATPDGFRNGCGGVWGTTGASLYAGMARFAAPSFVTTGLWRIDMPANLLTSVIPEADGSIFNVVDHVQPLADGSLRAFMLRTDTLPTLGDPRQLLYAPYAVQPDGTRQRLLETAGFELRQIIGWARDGSGFVVRGPDVIGRERTAWVPSDGSAPREIPEVGTQVRWSPNEF